ncbi:MAG TPA: hypothetical protein VJ953_00805, partial [Saprospiraceae bacterium]|nr:hypothetical protein [Saprospiraceae bacterium]
GVYNIATATGDDPNDDPVTDESEDPTPLDPTDPEYDPNCPDCTYTELPQNPAIAITKIGVYNTNDDEIAYTYVVSNTGNVTLFDIDVIEELGTFTGTGTPPEPVYLSGGVELGGDPNVLDLPVGSGVITFRATYNVTQVDIAAGSVTNQATATANDPDGDPVEDLSDDPNDPTDNDVEGDNEPDDPTVVEIPCITINAFVYLEGALINDDGSGAFGSAMRTELNDLRLLPGQTFTSIFTGNAVYSPSLPPYGLGPWDYFGNEQDAYDSNGNPNQGSAGYPSTVVDWVLVSLRPASDPAGEGGPICQAAALLHEDGRIEFVEGFACCEVDLNESYYLVVEHRNHLIVMSAEPIEVVNKTIVYDFRTQESYIDDPLGFGTFVGQKAVQAGNQTVYVMYGGNGNQTFSTEADTDITFEDESFWADENGVRELYLIQDYDLNGDVNLEDRRLWEQNNSKTTSVPRSNQ